jgi:signal transduction histidine kinase
LDRESRRPLRERFERLRQLYHVSQVIHSTLDSRKALDLIVNEAVRLTRASSGSVILLNPTSQFLEIEAAHGLPTAAAHVKLRLGEGITGWVARTGKAARVADVRRDSRYVMLRDSVRSELAVPLRVQEEVRGVINVDADRLDAFGPADQELLTELAVQAARVIQNTWLYEQLRLKARLFESLFQVGQTINSSINLDEVLQLITRETCHLMEAKVCALLLLDEAGEWLDLKACYGGGAAYLRKPRLQVADSLLGIVVRRKKAIQVENVQASSRYQSVEVARQEGLVGLLSVPLVFGGGTIGTLSVYTATPKVFSNEEVRILSALAELSAIAIEKARLYERIVEAEEQMRQSEKLSALGLLAAEVAHEIRNPLTVMKMLYHSLDLQFPAGDPRATDARIMGEKMEHLNRIVEQILDFARRAEPRLAASNLNQILEQLGLLIRHKLRQQSIRLVKELDPDLPVIMADAGQLEQAFLNLILNAVEAMPSGGTLVVTTRTLRRRRERNRPTHVTVAFRDSGHGMSAEQRQRAFSSLLSTTKARGTGLGLALVAKMVEAHHGQVRVQSTPGQGTCITLVFPAETSACG